MRLAELSDEYQAVLDRLLSQVWGKTTVNEKRDKLARAKDTLSLAGLSIPRSMEGLAIPLDWPRKAIEVFSSRLVPSGYSTRAATTLVGDVEDALSESDAVFLERQAIEAACRHGCAFVFTSRDDSAPMGVRVTARSARAASALIDPRTGEVTAALEVHDRQSVSLWLPGIVIDLEQRAGVWDAVDDHLTGTDRVLCAPYVHGATLDHPFGASRLTPTVMDLTWAGSRTMLRQEVASEFYMTPRALVLGAESSVFDSPAAWSAAIGAIWGLPDISVEDDSMMSDSLRRADVKQIPQMSMQPFSDQLRLIASQVSGATSIPLHYLGVVQDSNPTSAQALEAVENDLIRSVRGQYPSFNLGRRKLALNVLTAMHGDLSESARRELRGLTPRWDDPRTVSVDQQSRFVAQQVQAGNLVAGAESTIRLLPIQSEDVDGVMQSHRRTGGGALQQVLDRLSQPVSDRVGA